MLDILNKKVPTKIVHFIPMKNLNETSNNKQYFRVVEGSTTWNMIMKCSDGKLPRHITILE